MLLNNNDGDRARRFRDAALPHLDALYTVARYITRSPADAEDAVDLFPLVPRSLRFFQDDLHPVCAELS